MSKKDLISDILSIPSESRTLEFKRLGSRNESVDRPLQSIVAMANTDGGFIRNSAFGRYNKSLKTFQSLGKARSVD